MNNIILKNFPNVCRGCLKDLPFDKLISLDCVPIECDGFSVAECYAEFEPEIQRDSNDMLPSEVCYDCLHELKYFLSYRKRQKFLAKLIAAMAQLRQGNSTLLVDLFYDEMEYMQQVFQELNLCDGELLLDDLVCNKVEVVSEEISSEEENDDADVSEEIVPRIDVIEIAANAKAGRPKRTIKVPKRISEAFYERKNEKRKEENNAADVSVVVQQTEAVETVASAEIGRPKRTIKVPMRIAEAFRERKNRKRGEANDTADVSIAVQRTEAVEMVASAEADCSKKAAKVPKLRHEARQIEKQEQVTDVADDSVTVQRTEVFETEGNTKVCRSKRMTKVPKRIAEGFHERHKSKRSRDRPKKSDQSRIINQQHEKQEQIVEKDKINYNNLFSKVANSEPEGNDELSETDPLTDQATGFWNKPNYICKVENCQAGSFATRAEMVLHKKDQHCGNICEICGESFTAPSGLKNHKKRHVGRSYSCSYCDIILYTKTELNAHIQRRHVKSKEKSCFICGVHFADNRLLARHMEIHTNEKCFKCNLCGITLKCSNHRARHIAEVHLNIRYTCEHCQQSYGRKDKLRNHLEKTHGIQSYFVCDICLVSFETQSRLDVHRNRHNNPKQLECAICLLAFKNLENLNEHLCISYRDNYICCDRDWKNHQQYNKHQMYVHDVRTNVRVRPDPNKLMGEIRGQRKQQIRCPKCEKPFGSRIKKKLHEKTCTDSSPLSLKPVLVNISLK
ncbi:zinc finger protein 37-like [Sabethes cyaneus]|uniref:zinc finger protein 37-like n=1 Tax=Sabethes cyaneus TaxID=53552 RepID=UPI00237D40EF|nr:zinc finger protein 37-like [Sabethes cyaneus]